MIPAETPPGTTPPGTVPLFAFRGIRVFLHWSWALVAIWQINQGKGGYPHIGWDIAEYVTLFAIVLTHEFGHAFATRQVGGRADQILLWPFGGIAYVQTPPRPKAYLWGIAAGPLVNAVLWPILYGAAKLYASNLDPASAFVFANGDYYPDPMGLFLYRMFIINAVLLIFNLLPIFPMDGGQLLRGLLWFKMGPVKSILIAAWIGVILGGAVVLYVAIVWQTWFLALMMGLMVMQSWSVIQNVRAQQRG